MPTTWLMAASVNLQPYMEVGISLFMSASKTHISQGMNE